jgi:hypothetical protein
MNARRAPKLTKIGRLARWGLLSVLLPSYAFADAPCNVSGAPEGVLYMTVEAKITSNTAPKNGDVTCDSASVTNQTCFKVGDKQIQGLMRKGEAPVSFSGWAGGGGQTGSLKIEYGVCKNGKAVPMPREMVLRCTDGQAYEWGDGFGLSSESYGGEQRNWQTSFQGVIAKSSENYKDGCTRLQSGENPPAELNL